MAKILVTNNQIVILYTVKCDEGKIATIHLFLKIEQNFFKSDGKVTSKEFILSFARIP